MINMPEVVKFDEEKNIIRMVAFGDVTVEDMKSTFEQVLKIGAERNNYKFLADTRKQTSHSSLEELEAFISTVPSYLQIALLVSDAKKHSSIEESPEMKNRFMASIVESEGATIKTFIDEIEAINWLTSL